MRNAAILLIAGLSVCLIAVGCGGDDDDTTTAALTKQEFVNQADAICKQGNKQTDKAGAQLYDKGDRPSKEEQEKFITDTVLPGIQRQIDQVSALTPPEADQEQVTEFIDTAQAAFDKAEQDPSLMTSRGTDPFAKTNQLTKAYGLKEC